MTGRHIASGVWCIYVTQPGGKRVLDGEDTDSAKARALFQKAIRDEPPSAVVELVNPSGEVVDRSPAQ